MIRFEVAFSQGAGVTQRPTPRLFLFLFLYSLPADAQDIILKTGQTITTKGVRRSGDMVMGKVQVGASSGEVGYQTVTIAKINFPEPPQLKPPQRFSPKASRRRRSPISNRSLGI